MRACDHQIQTPGFVARIQDNYPQRDTLFFPYVRVAAVIPLEKMSVLPGETGIPRCK